MSALEVAQLYFKLSNQGDLVAIRDLFHNDAIYQSEQTGLFHGVEQIMGMMTQYFSDHETLNWKINGIQCTAEHEVVIDFTAEKIPHQGQPATIHGLERLVVVNDQIRQIEIKYPG